MSAITFKSIENDQIRYVFSHDSGLGEPFYNNPSQHVHVCALQFDTYGDGSVQHGPSFAVQRGQFLDYWGSLAYHLKENPIDIPDIERWFYSRVSKGDILFLSTVKYKEGKVRYYSKELNKVSSAPSKSFDKRWQEIPKDADGSIVSVYRFLCENYWSFTDRVMVLDFIRSVLADHTGSYGWINYVEILGIDFDNTDRQALQAIEAFCRSYREMENAKSIISCLDNNWILNKLDKAA